MNPEKLVELLGDWTSLKFFPADVQGRAAVAKQVAAMCADIDQARWLRDRLLLLFDEWPGPRTLRLVFCQRWKPADGLDIRGFCEQYPAPNGFPPIKPAEVSPSWPKLAPGAKVEPFLLPDAAVKSLPEPAPANRKRAQEFHQILEETLTPPEDRPKARLPHALKQSAIVRLHDDPEPDPRPAGTYKRINQADIDAAVARLHATEAHREDDDE